MTIFRHVVGLGRQNGLEEDRIINTWHTDDGQELENIADLPDVAQALVDFYLGMEGWLSSVLSSSTNAHFIRSYIVRPGAGPQGQDLLGSPQNLRTFTTAALSAQPPMPSEVACVLGMNADLTNVAEELGQTRPASRRRGRVYFGPLPTNAISNQGSDARPLAALRTALLNEGEGLVDAISVGTAHQLAVYSRTDGDARPVIRMTVDDAFDTIRSRGIKPSLKERRVVVP